MRDRARIVKSALPWRGLHLALCNGEAHRAYDIGKVVPARRFADRGFQVCQHFAVLQVLPDITVLTAQALPLCGHELLVTSISNPSHRRNAGVLIARSVFTSITVTVFEFRAARKASANSEDWRTVIP